MTGRKEEPLLVKRYASRRLYNTETSDYVTLEDIARLIREGRDVRIVDLKTGEDVTRQYLIQIIAEHESRGENVLPLEVLTDLVRSYASQAQSIMPQFLQASFEMLRGTQAQMMRNLTSIPNPMAATIPGLAELQKRQRAFLEAMMGAADRRESTEGEAGASGSDGQQTSDELEEIRRQLAELTRKLAELKGEEPERGG